MNNLKLPVFFILLLFAACQNSSDMISTAKDFDWQGHRGARGLLPENTIPAFKKALDTGMRTLELDIAVSADSVIVVSHEPWMSAEICLHPEGHEMTEEEGKEHRIYHLKYQDITLYDCGTKPHSRFPEQKKMKAVKPSLTEMVKTLEAYAAEKNYPAPFYNIEIKSEPAYDSILTPPIADFVSLTLARVKELGIAERTNLQSFDLRALEEIHKQDPTMRVAYLVEDALDTAKALDLLTFKPDIYSPYHVLVNAKMIEIARERKMKVIPWTVNDTGRMKTLIALGVDGIITDYPDRIPQ